MSQIAKQRAIIQDLNRILMLGNERQEALRQIRHWGRASNWEDAVRMRLVIDPDTNANFEAYKQESIAAITNTSNLIAQQLDDEDMSVGEARNKLRREMATLRKLRRGLIDAQLEKQEPVIIKEEPTS